MLTRTRGRVPSQPITGSPDAHSRLITSPLYSVFDGAFACNIEVRDHPLFGTQRPTPWLIHVELGDQSPDNIGPSAADWNLVEWKGAAPRFQQGFADGRHILRFSDVAEFVLDPTARCIQVLSRQPTARGQVQHLLINQALPYLVGHLFPLVIHGACVWTPMGAVALLGRSGSGKSTLATALDRKLGAPILADDSVRIAVADTAVRAWGNSPIPHLYSDSARHLGLPTANQGDPEGPRSKRRAASLGHSGLRPPVPGAPKLAAILELEYSPNAASKPLHTRLAPRMPSQAVTTLIRHSFLLDHLQAVSLQRHFAAAAGIIDAGTPVFGLYHRHDFSELDALCEMLIETLTALVSVPRNAIAE